jgi:cytidyltransferase-like protein
MEKTKTLVIVSGYFNPVHKGHIDYLKRSKELGDELFVIVNNDYQRALKGSTEFMKEEERYEIVSNLKPVDWAIIAIDKNREVAKTVQEIGKKYGYDVPIEHGEPRHEVKHAYCDHTKAKTILNFQDNTNLEELIETMFVWAMKQPNRKVKKMDYEITKDIYEYWK